MRLALGSFFEVVLLPVASGTSQTNNGFLFLFKGVLTGVVIWNKDPMKGP